MSRLSELRRNFGQSPWLDDLVDSGRLRALVLEGVRGVTTNPTIFRNVLAGGVADEDFVIARLRAAADVLHPVYADTAGEDGFVSAELAPDLAFDVAGSIVAAHRLRAAVDRPNLMIKVPATVQALPVIEQLVADGVPVNATLLFSVERYREVATAYLRGERRGQARVASVASFFVSRIDTRVDGLLERMGSVAALSLRGRAAVACAKLAYQAFKELFGADARPQRLLWASTGTKNPAYPDLLYVESLIGPRTVNTMPRATLEAFRDHGRLASTLESDVGGARDHLEALAAMGIDMGAVAAELEREGLAKFAADHEATIRT